MTTTPRSEPVRLLLVGLGSIGRDHAARILADADCRLVGVVDPAPTAAAAAAEFGAPHFTELDAAIAATRPEGVILATPNQLHEAGTLAALAHRLPVLVEKPVADDLAGARRMVAAARASGVPVMVGHHRRHGSIVKAARAAVARGDIGDPVAVSGLTLFHKPDGYFDAAWRRQKGAGPILLNLVHDIDLTRAIVGEIVEVLALSSHGRRGFEVEDGGGVVLRFAGGAIGTFVVSDAAVAPWSWELTSGEAPTYPRRDQLCLHIAGSRGALSLPDLTLWRNAGAPDWKAPLERTTLPHEPVDPLVEQLAQFRRVIRDGEAPLVDVADGTRTLAVIEAIGRAVRDGGRAEVEPTPA